MQVRSLALFSELRIQHCHELWCRSQLWLRSGIAVAVVEAGSCSLIGPLAWEPPYAAGVALKWKEKKKKMNAQSVATGIGKKKIWKGVLCIGWGRAGHALARH